MAELPVANNVFGYLRSGVGLEPVALALRARLGLNAEEVWVKRSAYDGAQTLRLQTAAFDFDAVPAKTANTWQFNGAVAGTPDEIFQALLPLVQNLKWAGFEAWFEIYDAGFTFVGHCPRPST